MFFLTILCSFLSYKVFFGSKLLNKYIAFSNSKIIVISLLTKIIVTIFFHNPAALVLAVQLNHVNPVMHVVPDAPAQLKRGDAVAQELINSLQILEVTASAMSAELKPVVRPLAYTLASHTLAQPTLGLGRSGLEGADPQHH